MKLTLFHESIFKHFHKYFGIYYLAALFMQYEKTKHSFYFVFICLCVSVSVCADPEDIGPLGAGVTVGCKAS